MKKLPVACAVFPALCLSLLSLAVGRAEAAGPAEPYGWYLQRVGVDFDDARPLPAAGLPRIELPEQIDLVDGEAVAQLQARVDAIEAEAGPYAPALSEALLELGRRLVAGGRAADAVSAYQRGLHVMRLNEGLYSDAQKPLVARLLALHRAAGDSGALDDLYDYYFRVHGSGVEPLDNAARAATLEYLRWQREALRTAAPTNSYRRLLTVFRLNERLLEQAMAPEAAAQREADTAAEESSANAAQFPGASPAADAVDTDWVEALTYSQLRNLYLIQALVTPAPDPLDMTAAGRYRRPEYVDTDITLDRLQDIQRSAVSRGRALLEELLPLLAAQPLALAAAMRELGDWHQWHGRARPAAQNYREAIGVLQAAGELSAARSWWSEPVELPANGALWKSIAGEEGEGAVVTASFAVSATGRAQRIETQPASGRKSATIAVARGLRNLRFRPVFDNQAPVASPRVMRDYRLLD